MAHFLNPDPLMVHTSTIGLEIKLKLKSLVSFQAEQTKCMP